MSVFTGPVHGLREGDLFCLRRVTFFHQRKKATKELMPDVPMVGVFDTAFHQTMPKKAFLYGLPYEYYEKYKVRRYGFHGTSHSFVSKRTAEFLGMDLKNSKIIVAHLGNGASISAVLNGECVDKIGRASCRERV